jgi:carbamate kinase
VIEEAAIRTLLSTHHVVAGGGGGVPMVARGTRYEPRPAVIDKDWIAALLAIRLDARQLVYVTDVSHVFDRFGHTTQAAIDTMTVAQARERLATGVFAAGSMAPKVESACQYVVATRRAAVIATVGHVDAALRGAAGTTITA